jgi:5-(hydroxymethyl)furfural/furfural oxidase
VTGFYTIIIGAGWAGCVLATRLSAHSARCVLLLEASQDTQPGRELANILDTFASSCYDKPYKWPGLKRTGVPAKIRRRPVRPGSHHGRRLRGRGADRMRRGMPADYNAFAELGDP